MMIYLSCRYLHVHMKSLLFQSHGLLYGTINHHFCPKLVRRITQKMLFDNRFFFKVLFRPHSSSCLSSSKFDIAKKILMLIFSSIFFQKKEMGSCISYIICTVGELRVRHQTISKQIL